jgi:hypothetical protein
MRWNNLWDGLAVRPTAGPSARAISPHPSSREGHHSTAWWNSSLLLLPFTLHGSHAVATSRVQRNSVPSTHMRCMITANRRASATIAFFIPRRLAICIAQALSQDHRVERKACSGPPRRASPASSHLRSVIFCRSDRSRPIDTWRTSARIRPRLTWIFGSERARQRWRDRSAPPRGRHRVWSSSAGTPHHPGRWPAGGDAG